MTMPTMNAGMPSRMNCKRAVLATSLLALARGVRTNHCQP